MVINFYKISEQLNYNVNNLEYTKNKTILSSPILTKIDFKITSIDQLYSDLIYDFLDKRVSTQYEDYGEYFEVNENTIQIKYYHQDYAEKCVIFNLFSVDFYLTSNTYLDCNREIFNKEFFLKFEECPYEIHIIEIATIKQQLSESDSEDEDDENQPRPLEFKQSITVDECVICLINKPNVLYPNCQHIPTCKTCEETHPVHKCPLCRKKATIKHII